MTNDELCLLDASRLGALVRNKDVSPVEVVQAFLSRTERLEPRLNCFVTVLADQALAGARKAEAEIAQGQYRGPLHGLPVALKDIFDVAGVKTTASSRVLANNVAKADSTVARKLQEAGAVVFGKTNLHEFAFGITTNNPHFGATRNPWDTSRVPGGSSGGSGAAVAASLCPLTTGTDTGGSIRIPAALCGIVGLKPTFGRVSKAGVTTLAWSLDHTGPMTKTVADAALMLNAIAGFDPADPATVDVPVPDFTAALGKPVAGMRIGLPTRFFFEDMDDAVREAVLAGARQFEALGVIVEEVDLPHIQYASAAFSPIIQAEAAAYHEQWYLEHASDYGQDVRARIEVGRTVLATQYINAQRARVLIRRDFEQALRKVDAVLAPTVPTTAGPIGVESVTIGGKTFELRAAYNGKTSPINLAGLPALAVPCGFSAEGLPIGMQLIGRAFDEETLLTLGHAYEAATDWHLRQPPL